MKLTKQNGRFVFLCTIAERFPAREAGFQWNSREAPNVWSTDSARRALKLAAYAEDDLRAEILRLAQSEPDPDRITLLFDNQTYRYFSPYEYKELARNAGMRYAKHPRPHWYTQDAETAIRCFNNASQYEGLFECAPELRAQLESHLEQRNDALQASRALDAEIEIPSPPGCEFLPFQKAGIAYAIERKNTLFGDEMGLGKSIEAIGVYNATGAKTMLVVCPASLKLNWQREIEKWAVRKPLVAIAEKSFWPTGADVIIINYEALGRKAMEGRNVLRREIRDVTWDLLVVDEIHRCKSAKTQRSKFTFAIKAHRTLGLTGTPIPNKPIEAQPILSFLCPDVKQFEYWPYAKRFAAMHKGPFGWDVSGASNLPELQSAMRQHCMIRRLKSEVLKELPPKRRQVIELPAEKLKSLIEAEQGALARTEAMRADLRLRVELAKASDDPAEYEQAVDELKQGARTAFEEMSRLRHETALAKLPLVVEHVTDMLEEQPKVIIFGWHKDVLNELHSIFKDSVLVHGDVALLERQAAVDRFQNDPTCRVFIGGINAAGVGLTLTAAPVVIFCELDWVPANITQAEDRAHRIGQEADSVLIQHLVLEGSLDAQMARTLVAKQEIADRALDRQGGIDMSLDNVDTEFPEQELILPERLASTDESMLQHRPATFDVKREQIAKEAEALSEKEIELVHYGLKVLAGLCDGAFARDSVGFNAMDSNIGKSLAAHGALTPKAAALGKRILKKYSKTQLKGIVDELWH